MSLREKNKAKNRDKIINAAKEIIREEGLEKLNMRYLANKAEVSLRTPYNLFGSKTDVLLALLDDIPQQLFEIAQTTQNSSQLGLLFEIADQSFQHCLSDEKFYRDIYWGIMSSEHKESRDRAILTIETLSLPLIHQAITNKELSAELDAKTFNHHIIIVAVALLGMWGSSQMKASEASNQIKYTWCNSFLSHATRKSKPELLALLKNISL